MTMTSARGSGSAKKSPRLSSIRPVSPAFAFSRRAIGETAGKS